MHHVLARALCAVAITTTVAACGGGSSTDSGSGSGSGGSSPVATKAAATFEKLTTRPDQVALKTPVGKPIPRGKRIGFVDCGASICTQQGKIVETAAKTLGWTVKAYRTDGTPQQIQSAWAQMLKDAPDGIVYTGTPRALIDKYLKEAESKGIKVSACCVVDPTEDGLLYNFDGPEAEDPGLAWASFVASDSDGKGKALYVGIPDFPINKSRDASLDRRMGELCPDCSVEQLDISLAQSGKDAPQLVTSYLRSHRDVKYVIQSTDFTGIGLPAALKAAGINDVKIIGLGPDTTNLAYIASGQQAASVYYPLYENMYALVDSLARIFAGVPTVDWKPPIWVVTKDNLPSTKALFPVVEDLSKQFAALWGAA
jgi:ribose transport system substrate-binding protein